MFKLNLKLKKFKVFIKKLPRKLAENYFLTFFVLILISVLIGLVIFYQSNNGVGNSTTISEEEVLKFDEVTYQKVLEEWQKRNQNLLNLVDKEYSDPF